ncbi:MAG: CarD family transcriptional regulator [Candidatus Dojkabacteria bacterium]|nr:MAG: CarD family transcriptional regulator [Candidatus Dojkabacteria bacterium]
MLDHSIFKNELDNIQPVEGRANDKQLVLVTGLPKFLNQVGANLLASHYGQRVELVQIADKESLEELMENIDKLKVDSVKIAVGKELQLAERLVSYNYMRVSRVWEPGEFSLFGDVVICWPKDGSHPVRVSYFGNEVESISLLDPVTRKKSEELKSFELINNESGLSFASVIIGESLVSDKEKANIQPPIFVVIESLSNIERGEIRLPSIDIGFRQLPIKEIYKNNAEVIGKLLNKYIADGYKVDLIVNGKSEEGRLPEELKKVGNVVYSRTLPFTTSKGFISSLNKELYVTPFELFGSIDTQKFAKLAGRSKSSVNTSDEFLRNLLPGDFVVHEDHGIGEYVGIVDRGEELFVLVKYAGKDRLYVPLDQISRLTRYLGTGRRVPKLTTLNSGAWRRVKHKVEEDAEKLARHLLRIYALRKMNKDKGIIVDSGSRDVEKFIDAFQFTDTDDQSAATEEIMSDLYSGVPMDRLIVGDVGFGKTEVAMRAMFAAVDSGHQVAFLAPTTILVEQHLAVLRERFKDFDVSIASISRFLGKGEVQEVIDGVAKGEVQIVVGTHSLLSDQVKFNKLGLVVIDEEQKFGVKHKEKLKAHRVDVHVLSMSATPIPRTLNMALSGIRDISVISTPPSGRKPIRNHFAKFSWSLVEKAVKGEVDRGGQVYFLHNNVKNMASIKAQMAEKLGPKIKIEMAHGQMDDDMLGMVMREFAAGDIDVLVCSTIIENGIDLPNVNCLIVNDAENFGLSQLYQIRGRIGRSDKQAYAYFTYKNLRGDAGNRLDALSESEELGSGLLLANRDLEIRGAGNVLGREQSGSIDTVGYGLFMKMLEDKIEEMRAKPA